MSSAVGQDLSGRVPRAAGDPHANEDIPAHLFHRHRIARMEREAARTNAVRVAGSGVTRNTSVGDRSQNAVPSRVHASGSPLNTSRTVILFIGVSTGIRQETFCEVHQLPRSVAPSSSSVFLGDIMNYLATDNSRASRHLASVRNNGHRDTLYIATSRVPVPVDQNYTNVSTDFRELGTFDEAPQQRNRWTEMYQEAVLACRGSEERNDLLSRRGRSESTPVFVLYVYTDRNTGESIPAVGASSAPSPNTRRLVRRSNGDVGGLNFSRTPATQFLESRFSEMREALRQWCSPTSGFGTAYRHILMERQTVNVCRQVGVVVLPGMIAPAIVRGGLQIDLLDVAAWLSVGSINMKRTTAKQAREARRLLQKHKGYEAASGRDMGPDLQYCLQLLDAMFKEELLPSPVGNDVAMDAQWEAATIGLTQFTNKVNTIRTTLG
ncbi:hypothetical protein BC834DRAFT_92270 [Gloeopeniophorella convolvens]|nr:hypothetical protein BC834DRAFT_92270 [Gloeopeniophorella convolvens]